MAARVDSIDLDGGDAALVQRARSGDSTAFTELYSRHFPALVRFIERRVSNHDVAEELAQEAFARALDKLHTLRQPDRFHAWLMSISRHLILRHYTTRGRTVPVRDVPEGWYAAADEGALREVDRQQIREAFTHLNFRHQRVLQLREKEELSYEAIAKRLGTPETTVPPLLHRARQALRREYLKVVARDPASGSLVVVAGFGHLLRRMRNRVSRHVTWLPDASMLCASASCVVVGLTAMFPFARAVTLDGRTQDVSSYSANGSDVVLDSGPDSNSHRPVEVRIGPSEQVERTAEPIIRRGAEIAIDRHNTDRTREMMRRMPIFYEVGPYSFGADPDAMRRDIDSSLEGDLGWTEGKCHSDYEDCS